MLTYQKKFILAPIAFQKKTINYKQYGKEKEN